MEKVSTRRLVMAIVAGSVAMVISLGWLLDEGVTPGFARGMMFGMTLVLVASAVAELAARWWSRAA